MHQIGRYIRSTPFSQDSFICSTQGTLITSTDDSMDIDQVQLQSQENIIYSPNNFLNKICNNQYEKNKTYYQSKSTYLTNMFLSSEKVIIL